MLIELVKFDGTTILVNPAQVVYIAEEPRNLKDSTALTLVYLGDIHNAVQVKGTAHDVNMKLFPPGPVEVLGDPFAPSMQHDKGWGDLVTPWRERLGLDVEPDDVEKGKEPTTGDVKEGWVEPSKTGEMPGQTSITDEVD